MAQSKWYQTLVIAAKLTNDNLSRINIWCKENKLTFTIIKTEYITDGSKNKKDRSPEVQIKIGIENLREVETYKYIVTERMIS